MKRVTIFLALVMLAQPAKAITYEELYLKCVPLWLMYYDRENFLNKNYTDVTANLHYCSGYLTAVRHLTSLVCQLEPNSVFAKNTFVKDIPQLLNDFADFVEDNPDHNSYRANPLMFVANFPCK